MFFFSPTASLALRLGHVSLKPICLYNCSNFFLVITFYLFLFSLTLPSHFFFISHPWRISFSGRLPCSLWQCFIEAQIVIMIKTCSCREPHLRRWHCSADISSSVSPPFYKGRASFPGVTCKGKHSHILHLKRTVGGYMLIRVHPASGTSLPLTPPSGYHLEL